jgi:CRP/FNR family transcriptional regulator, anaerobic regulatory protein
MPEAAIVDLSNLKRSCAQCSLVQLCLPASIGGEDLDRLDRAVLSKRPFKRGDRLFNAGQPMQALYVARDGAFKSYTQDENGDLQIIGFHLPGELIGLDGLANERHRCSAEALSSARVCEVPFPQLQHIASQVPGLQRQLMRIIGRGMVQDHQHLEMMGRKQALERLAIFLHSLSERFAALGENPHRFTLPMSREDIANYLGLVLETVSRLFGKLQQQGVIALDRRRVDILDAAALALLTGEGAHAVAGKRAG